MSIIKHFIILFIVLIFNNHVVAEEIKKIGKFKDWEAMVIKNENETVCFAQTKPVLQSPKNNPREARLFVSFRPNEKISDEISNFKDQESVMDIINNSNWKLTPPIVIMPVPSSTKTCL